MLSATEIARTFYQNITHPQVKVVGISTAAVCSITFVFSLISLTWEFQRSHHFTNKSNDKQRTVISDMTRIIFLTQAPIYAGITLLAIFDKALSLKQ
ncbi:MAG TPA: hypothetical protein PLC42_03430 [Parachlamydiaceae bacterium]|nr:hypothetical protein [Parachlamydiaceae bacterium]